MSRRGFVAAEINAFVPDPNVSKSLSDTIGNAALFIFTTKYWRYIKMFIFKTIK